MKKAYWIEFESRLDSNQYLMLSEFHLIRTMLKEGRIITRLEKVELTESQFKSEFGI